MTKSLSKLLNLLLAPIKDHRIAFVFLSLALFLPELSAEVDFKWINKNPMFFSYRLLNCVGFSYLLLVLVHLLSKLNAWAGKVLLFVIHVFVFTLVFTDIFIFNVFGTHINIFMLQVVDETTTQETSEFLSTYTRTRPFRVNFSQFLVFVGAEIALMRVKNPKNWLEKLNVKQPIVQACKNGIAIVAGLLVALTLGFLIYMSPCYTLDWAKNYEQQRAWDSSIVSTFVFQTYQAVVQYFDEQSSFERCGKAQQNLVASLNDIETPNIVIIIGESYNRHHSSLYGYEHETCPRLAKLPNLYVFDDVISPINGTSPAFKSFLSLSSADDSLAWHDVPLFPTFFKQVGYNVTFFSNQFVKQLNMTPWDASAGFFNHPKVEPYIFSHRNSKKHNYDEGLIEEYCNQRSEVESDSLNLIFFHLIGQHVKTNQRFPAGREKFHVSDYNRPELTEEQIQEVADYDNATAYNDSVVCEIIRIFQDKDAVILYFADHGDEANDYRPHVGRTHNLNEMGVPALHCQLDIPFLIYLTDSCRTLHPELEQRVAQSTHRPFMLDDLPHLLFDIAGIQTPWFQPSRSPINDNYNASRHRIIDGYSAIPPIDYDAACKAYGKWEIGFNKMNDK